MIGVIYKFTIIAKYKIDGHKPFYVGQHWCNSEEEFLNKNYFYYGSGIIWNKFIKKLKEEYPQNWRNFIKREILCKLKPEYPQDKLNKIEEFWIKRERACRRYRLGGCNCTEYSQNPAKDPKVAQKISESKKNGYHPYRGKHLSEEHREHIRISLMGDKNPFYGRKHSKESIEKMRLAHIGRPSALKGRKMSEESRMKMSITAKRRLANPENNNMYGKRHTEKSKELNRLKHLGKHPSEETRKKMSIASKRNATGRKSITNGIENHWWHVGMPMPEGYHLGHTTKGRVAI